MNLLREVSTGADVPNEINVAVSIPRGSKNKYEFDEEAGFMRLDRVLRAPSAYPTDYGDIPQTLGEDGDALDALVLIDEPLWPGVIVAARPVGVLNMIDQGEGDAKILCVPADDVSKSHIKDLSDVPTAQLEQIAEFFMTYKRLEKKEVEVTGWEDAAAAKRIIEESVTRFQEKHS